MMSRIFKQQAAVGLVSLGAMGAGMVAPWPDPWYGAGAIGLLFVALRMAWTVAAEMTAARTQRDRGQDQRGLVRLKVAFRGTLDWTGPEGHSQSARMTGIDLTRLGALAETRVPLACGSTVFVNISSHRLMGVAQVRHCTQAKRGRYRIGLQFRGPLMPQERGGWTIQYSDPK